MEVKTMKYMLLIYAEAQADRSEKERQDCHHEAVKLADELRAKGQYVAANPLHPAAMATSVRIGDGKRFVTDGPFAETHEQLGGYFLIDVTDRDEATAIAARGAVARVGIVEIRPVREGPPT